MKQLTVVGIGCSGETYIAGSRELSLSITIESPDSVSTEIEAIGLDIPIRYTHSVGAQVTVMSLEGKYYWKPLSHDDSITK